MIAKPARQAPKPARKWAARRLAALLLTLVTAAAAAGTAAAQEDDLKQPPRIDPGPGAARLEAPEPEKERVLEEVVVVGGPRWRLPDLGGSWRAEHEDNKPHGRIEVSFLPVYDPENADQTIDAFALDRETRRVGFIKVFKVRFGGRPRIEPE